MKKILLITQHFPPFPGGAQNYYYQLCNRLSSDSIVVLADDACVDAFSDLKPEFKYSVLYRQFYFQSPYIWPKWLLLLYHAYRVIRRERPEILWAGEPLPKGVVALILSRIFRLPYFVTTHGADVLNPRRRRGLIGRWKTWLLTLVLTRASFVTANSEYTRLAVSKLGVAHERSLVVYPSGSIVSPAPDVRSEFIWNLESLKRRGYTILLTACRVVRRKGVDRVLAALPRVLKEHSRVAYVVVGDGEYREMLERQARGIDGEIIFTGALSADEMKVVYALCDIFIMLPREEGGLIEGFGIVYLEAGSFSKPVIGSKVGGVPEAVVDLFDYNQKTATGLLVDDPYNPYEVAKKILMLVKDEGLARKLGENGKHRSEEFVWEKGIEKIVNRVDQVN